jgi:hypothetical protein
MQTVIIIGVIGVGVFFLGDALDRPSLPRLESIGILMQLIGAVTAVLPFCVVILSMLAPTMIAPPTTQKEVHRATLRVVDYAQNLRPPLDATQASREFRQAMNSVTTPVQLAWRRGKVATASYQFAVTSSGHHECVTYRRATTVWSVHQGRCA